MSVRLKSICYNGVLVYLQKNFNLPAPRSKSFRAFEEMINDIQIKYLKEYNIECKKNNSRGYRGNYSPAMDNSVDVQGNWNQFKEWCNINLEKKESER